MRIKKKKEIIPKIKHQEDVDMRREPMPVRKGTTSRSVFPHGYYSSIRSQVYIILLILFFLLHFRFLFKGVNEKNLEKTEITKEKNDPRTK